MAEQGQQKVRVNKVTASGGRVFYTREQDRSKLLTLPGVERIEDALMTEAEYNAIPASDESRAFLAGADDVRGRGE